MSNDPFNVLILEDDKLICDLVKLAAQEANTKTHIAHTCKEAEEILKRVSPDLAILDIGLPDGDGRDFARNMTVSAPGGTPVPTIFLTGRDDYDSRIDSFMVDAIDYITKPFSVFQFGLKIKNLVGILSTSQAAREKENILPEFDEPQNRRSEFFISVYELCQDNCENPDYSIMDVSNSLNLSTRTLQRRLRKNHGRSFSEILYEVRMAKAQVLLQKDYTPKDVARLCGYRHSENFAVAFRRVTKTSPRKFRRLANKSNQPEIGGEKNDETQVS